MSAGFVGYVIGGFMFSLLLPAITLMIGRFVPATKRNPHGRLLSVRRGGSCSVLPRCARR